MKRFWATLIAVALVGFVMIPAAHAVVVSLTVPVDGVVLTNACNGEGVTLSGSEHIVAGVSSDEAGGFHVNVHLNFQGVKGVGPTGTRYRVHQAATFNGQFTSATTATEVFTMTVVSAGNYSKFVTRQLVHFTITPDGQITVTPAELTVDQCVP